MKTIKFSAIKWDPKGKGYNWVKEFTTASFYSQNNNITAAEAIANLESQSSCRVLACNLQIINDFID
ncbi:MAG: hypothetical protein IJE60_06270 [Tyzzerella sp.]|nr:hypothetical protein [Tyzzerella sp.]